MGYIKKETEAGLFLAFMSMDQLHIVMGMQLLHIDSMLHLNSFELRRLVELLTRTELFDDTGLVEFAFKLLNGAFDILAFFYGYYDHCIHLLSKYTVPWVKKSSNHERDCKITTFF